MNYYNEHDPKTAAWLRELIKVKLIPTGDVDERSITEVQPDEIRHYTQCHFFAGIGGWSLALQLAGWPADRPVWTGSCPCQPFSSAGKGLAQADERHLWPTFFDLIRQCRPDTCFGEQVASAIGKGWLDGISTDLESENYACGSIVLGAHSVGSPHIRQRLYWLADSCGNGRNQAGQCQPKERGDGAFRDGIASGMANSISERGCSRKSRHEDAGDAGIASQVDRPIRMVDTIEQGLQGQQRPTAMELHGTEGQERPTRETGVWDQFDIVPCRDGKSRRIECQSRRLADGVPSLLDALRDTGATEEQIEAAINPFPLVTKQAGRVMLLKGYGNAIVPQCAAEFVKAFSSISLIT